MQKRTFLRSLSGLAAVAVAGAVNLHPARSFAAEASAAATASPAKRRIAFVYFSKTGHTASVAAAARAMTGCDVFEVKTVKPYPAEYGPTTEVVKEELEKGVEREIIAPKLSLADYDVVCLRTPTWWHHVAMPLQTWIKSQNFTDKLVLTCNTHGGGGLMHTREDFEKLLGNSGAKLGTHLTVFGDVAEDDADVRQWLAENGLIGK